MAEANAIVPASEARAIAALDEARRQIGLARRSGDVNALKEWRDRAAAVQHYARQRAGAKEIANDAGEVKVRAEAALGAIDGEINPPSRGVASPPEATIIEAAAATRAAWRKLGTLEEQQLDEYIERAREDEQAGVSTAQIAKLVDADKKHSREQERREHRAAATSGGTGRLDLRHVDALTLLESLEPASADLLLTDPPYSTDVDDIDSFAAEWVPLALSRIKDSGRFYICCGAYPYELRAYLNVLLDQERFFVGVPLVWTYRNTLGPAPAHGYKTNWQAILYGHGAEAPPLDCPEMLEQFTVQDIAAPDGRHGTRFHEWQKPDELAERLLRHSTRLGELVLDPFAGTGTFAAAGVRLGRNVIASDVDEDMLGICARRGLSLAA